MGRKRVAPSIVWWDGSKLDAQIAIALCLGMIREAYMSIWRYNKRHKK